MYVGLFTSSNFVVFTFFSLLSHFIFPQASPLVRTMDIFLRDPIVDWVESCARKRPSSGDDDDEDDDDEMEGVAGRKNSITKPVWEPTRRIRNARRKLSGANPVDVLLDDLKQNPTVTALKSLPALEAMLRGQDASSGSSSRGSSTGGGGRSVKAPARATNARLQEATQSAADQVACLVDMAVDPNLLGRQWIGLASWM